MRLIEVLNMIAKGELKEGTKVKWQKMKYIFEDGELEREGNEETVNIFEDMYCINLNDEEVELIEPPCEHEWEVETIRNGIGDLRRFRRCVKCGFREEADKCIPDEGKTLEPTKIEELIDWYATTNDDKSNEMLLHIVWNKLNEVINKVNAQTEVILAHRKDIDEIKEQLDY